ncbi:MAG: hypothetical protein ACXVDF_00635 [Ktedonobacterales bacterium]
MAATAGDPMAQHRADGDMRKRESAQVYVHAPVRTPAWSRFVGAYILLTLTLIGVERVSFEVARIPMHLTIGPNIGSLEIDGSNLLISWANTNPSGEQSPISPTAAVFVYTSPLRREFQIDGTDSTNNFTEDDAYLRRIATSPYYRFQAAMRGNASYSTWRDITAVTTTTQTRLHPTSTANGTRLSFPSQTTVEITASLGRPETTAQVLLLCTDIPCAEILIDRNDRFIVFHTLLADGSFGEECKAFFPNQQLPFLAEVLNDLARTALWSLALLGLLAALQVPSVILIRWARKLGTVGVSSYRPFDQWSTSWRRLIAQSKRAYHRIASLSISLRKGRVLAHASKLDMAAGMTILASFAFTLYIALAQYRGYPHILDASAYYFQAKVFASGRLSAPAPRVLSAFQGPFMIASQGRWFAQYAPATSLLLALGMLLHVPWLIEPLLGAAALWGIYRIGCLLFSPFEGWLAVALAAVSPFYTFLVPSYLSHTPALFFAVYFLLTLLRFGREQRPHDLLLAAVSLDGLLLTRELSAAILAIVTIPYVAFIYRKTLLHNLVERLPAVLAASAIFCAGVFVYLGYNWLQTGDVLTTPRTLFSPSDRYGFGDGIGFYGRHTLAAGLVNLDQLLTVLQIDLFGWPFYLTLAFIPCAFLRLLHRRNHSGSPPSGVRWDTFCLLLLCAMVVAQVGYFYHGIFLGPRYLYETLPFLLLLTARGITALVATLDRLARSRMLQPSAIGRGAPFIPISCGVIGIALLALLACNLLYFMPRQLELHTNFSGLPSFRPIDTGAVYGFRPTSAVIVTSDKSVYNYILWPLNDPDLHGPTIYAYAPTPDSVAQVRAIYSSRTFYTLSIAPNGQVSFTKLAG